SGNVMTIQNTLVRLQPMDGVYTGPVPGHGAFFEWSATSPQLALYNNVFRADQPSNDGDEHMAPPPGKLAGCSNNVMVWLGAGAFPEPLPSCFTVMTGATGLDYWNRAVAQWQANHPPALADVGAPVVSLFTPADNTGIDASAAQWRTAAPISIRLGGGANLCFHGGETVGNLPPATSWSAALNYYAVVPDGPNVTVEGVRTFDRGDGVAFGSNAPNWTLRGAYVHYARDGCVENHFVFAGTVDDALLDGCFIGFASRPYRAVADGSGNVMTIQNTLVRLQPMDGVYTGPVPGHGAFFEGSATSPQLALYNNVFRAAQPSNDGNEHMAPPPGKLAGCSNNVMVWLGAGALREPSPSCFTVMTGARGLDYWNRAVAQWQANHLPALADAGPPVVSLFTAAA